MIHKKISFCTVCRNRLSHLRETLPTNILDNQSQDVEFVLLDYNSDDGLEEWVKSEMTDFIKSSDLVYYKYPTARYFHRTHSRNIAMLLSTGDIICNVDADNYIGKGFASYLIDLFSKNDNLFATPDYTFLDTIGRVTLLKKDFMRVRGYNELFDGYGFEDLELYHRLQNSGLRQMYIDHPSFFKAIPHPDILRICEEEKVLRKSGIPRERWS